MTTIVDRLQNVSARIRATAEDAATDHNDPELDDMLEKADDLICTAIALAGKTSR